MKKALLISFDDVKAGGHGYSCYKALKDKGHDVHFLSLVSLGEDIVLDQAKQFFFKNHRHLLPWHSYFWYKVKRRIRTNLYKQTRNSSEFCFYNTSNYYTKSAKQILSHSIVDPDIIVLFWCDFFVSPKTIRELFELTGAMIVVVMVDAHILGGGCHYPCNCRQYITGCGSCPALVFSKSARKLFEAKVNCFKGIPLTIIGTACDIKRAKESPFLKDKHMLSSVGVPKIPFVKSKSVARNDFKIPEGDFVILCGAASLEDRRKGFSYLIHALESFSQHIGNRKVKLLALGNGIITEALSIPNIDIVTPGFLDMNDLFTAFYASDVFVSSSIDDSGPYMVNYSIACGTPVISFPIGVALDLVKNGETGYLADYLSYYDMAKRLYDIYSLTPEEWDAFSSNCISLMRCLEQSQKDWIEELIKE